MKEIKPASYQDHNGKTINYIRMGYAAGKKYFYSLGYVDCTNKNYLQKNESIVHYNNILKAWLIE